jgi:hypothetical protein
MARGWESKAVEAQIEDAERDNADRIKDRLSSKQVEILRKKEGLLLSQARVRRDLEASRNPRYQSILREALNHLEHELAALEESQAPPKA